MKIAKRRSEEVRVRILMRRLPDIIERAFLKAWHQYVDRVFSVAS